MERMDFGSFYCEFLLHSGVSEVETAIYAPLIYDYEDRYYDACLAFLKTGEKVEVEYKGFSTGVIQSSMNTSYVQALVILHHIETMPQRAPMIFFPDPVE